MLTDIDSITLVILDAVLRIVTVLHHEERRNIRTQGNKDKTRKNTIKVKQPTLYIYPPNLMCLETLMKAKAESA